jgi:hypothetical protein
VDRPAINVGNNTCYKQIDDWTGAVLDEYSMTVSSC